MRLVRVLRRSSALALPLISATDSAKFAKITVSQSQIATSPKNNACPSGDERVEEADRGDEAADLDGQHYRVSPQ